MAHHIMLEQPLFLAACYATDPVLSVTTESLGDGGVAVRGAGEQAASKAAATAVRPRAIFALTCRIRIPRMITP